MKKYYTTIFSLVSIFCLQTSMAQQVDNSGFENWDALGTAEEEPTNWNGMMTGDLCFLCEFGASQRVFRDDTAYHSGAYSVRIETGDYLGNAVNGALTVGEVNAPSTDASEGYNETLTGNDDFNHAFTSSPDSIVFWAKYSITDGQDSARVSAILHDDYDARDPQDMNTEPHVVASAELNFQTDGNGEWKRISLPWVYDGAASTVEYILITFTSSYTPGSGVNGASLWIDDLEMIYNSTSSITETKEDLAKVYAANSMIFVDMQGANYTNVKVKVYTLAGQLVTTTEITSDKTSIPMNEKGMYVVSVEGDNVLTRSKLKID